ncbi:MAG: hypothetical protein ACRCXT_02830 [Paraclostridium sp.]
MKNCEKKLKRDIKEISLPLQKKQYGPYIEKINNKLKEIQEEINYKINN